jgi:hypothetical protein
MIMVTQRDQTSKHRNNEAVADGDSGNRGRSGRHGDDRGQLSVSICISGGNNAYHVENRSIARPNERTELRNAVPGF